MKTKNVREAELLRTTFAGPLRIHTTFNSTRGKTHLVTLGLRGGRLLLLLLWRIGLALKMWCVLKVKCHSRESRGEGLCGFADRWAILDMVEVAGDGGVRVVLCWLQL